MKIQVKCFAEGDPVELSMAGVTVELNEEEMDDLMDKLEAAHEFAFGPGVGSYGFDAEVEIG